MENGESYSIRVKGESLTDWSGAVPEDIQSLLMKPSADAANLLFEIVKTQVELLCQKGDTLGAMEAFEKWRVESLKETQTYKAPLNCFKRDHQNGQSPYQGGHCFYGAFRDAAGELFEIYYKKKGDLQNGKSSDKHLRKSVRIIPNHVSLFRNGKKIDKPDKVEDQQPTEGTPGFARYEVIHHPFSFEFTIQVLPKGPFKSFLSDRKRVIEALYSSTLNGQGSRRSAGYGGWRIVDAKVEDWSIAP
jgi:hypothetical protein